MSTSAFPPRLWQLPPSLSEDLAAFERNVAQFKSGAISPTQFQVFRVPQGVYEQRESGSYMLRVRLPGGVALPHQLRSLATTARRHGDGILHVTTRQDIQIHHAAIDALHPALVELAQAGLSTKGGGGNTVRNITGCPHAGVCADEAFDVTPHVLALTEYCLRDPQSFALPRKLKFAFSGCGRDCSGATVADLGFIAKKRDGIEGFAVYVGGGLGSVCRVADLLEEFVPAPELPRLAEAVKRVFNALGNRKDRRQARLRFLVRQLGLDRFRQLYREQRDIVRSENRPAPATQPLPVPAATADSAPPSPVETAPGYAAWLANHVAPQRQTGFHRVDIPLPLGDISADKLESLATAIEHHGERMVRATPTQGLVLRWVRTSELPALHRALDRLGLGTGKPPVLRNLVACTGAATCKLGICLSRGLARAVTRSLEGRGDLAALGNLRIHISGCPNSCSRHPGADIGLFGGARRIDGHLVPHYTVLFGGWIEEGRTEFAGGGVTIPARRVPAFLSDLLDVFARSPSRPDPRAFWRKSGDPIAALAAKHKHVPSFAEDKDFYHDWDAGEPFSLAGRGPGECGAGVIDLIAVDLKSAAEALDAGRFHPAAALAARALLVVRGEQAADDREAFALFQKHFLETGLADARFAGLVSDGLRLAGQPGATEAFAGRAGEAKEFVASVRALFERMDATLAFPPPAGTCPAAGPTNAHRQAPAAMAATEPAFDLQKDFRGVVCPLNYVKTKMALGGLRAGQTLAVLLDEPGTRNVPDSARNDGHEVLSITRLGDHSRVVIRRK